MLQSCHKGEELPSEPQEHAGEVHSLETEAVAGPPKSLRSADQATANERQPVDPPLAQVEVEDRLAAVQVQISMDNIQISMDQIDHTGG